MFYIGSVSYDIYYAGIMLNAFATYYAHNYASIIGSSLLANYASIILSIVGSYVYERTEHNASKIGKSLSIIQLKHIKIKFLIVYHTFVPLQKLYD